MKKVCTSYDNIWTEDVQGGDLRILPNSELWIRYYLLKKVPKYVNSFPILNMITKVVIYNNKVNPIWAPDTNTVQLYHTDRQI